MVDFELRNVCKKIRWFVGWRNYALSFGRLWNITFIRPLLYRQCLVDITSKVVKMFESTNADIFDIQLNFISDFIQALNFTIKSFGSMWPIQNLIGSGRLLEILAVGSIKISVLTDCGPAINESYKFFLFACHSFRRKTYGLKGRWPKANSNNDKFLTKNRAALRTKYEKRYIKCRLFTEIALAYCLCTSSYKHHLGN